MAGLRVGDSEAGGDNVGFGLVPPMPKPGTDTPAALNLLNEP